jgi:hypothetical protein
MVSPARVAAFGAKVVVVVPLTELLVALPAAGTWLVPVALVGGVVESIVIGCGPIGAVPGEVLLGTLIRDELRTAASEVTVARFKLVSFGEVAAGSAVLEAAGSWFVVAVGSVVVLVVGSVGVVVVGNVLVVAVAIPEFVAVGNPLLTAPAVGKPVLPVVEVERPELTPVEAPAFEPVALPPAPVVCAASKAAELTRPARKREALVFIGQWNVERNLRARAGDGRDRLMEATDRSERPLFRSENLPQSLPRFA